MVIIKEFTDTRKPAEIWVDGKRLVQGDKIPGLSDELYNWAHDALFFSIDYRQDYYNDPVGPDWPIASEVGFFSSTTLLYRRLLEESCLR